MAGSLWISELREPALAVLWATLGLAMLAALVAMYLKMRHQRQLQQRNSVADPNHAVQVACGLVRKHPVLSVALSAGLGWFLSQDSKLRNELMNAGMEELSRWLENSDRNS